MPDLSTKTNDALFDRLSQIEGEINARAERPIAGIEDAVTASVQLHEWLSEIALIHIELAKRTATGWRPL